MTDKHQFTREGVTFTAYADGSLLVNHENLLVFSDLHLEKGRAMAGTAPLPEMDTDTTLKNMTKAIGRDEPEAVLFLGDSFHRSQMANTLPDRHRDALNAALMGRQVIWITGNHDPGPLDLGGEHLSEVIRIYIPIFLKDLYRFPFVNLLF
ncbi:MAG: hypothetical protein EBZ18_06080, partial [Alphaproteobacteria bacterium]|nr:hypothetical protein [Alphaproteobacteria bacterium]